MKAVKTFDLFQKISFDNINRPTLLGGILSISAIGLMIFLLITETLQYFTPYITKDSFIHQSTSNSTIPLTFELKTLSVPCALISIDHEDLIGNHKVNIDTPKIQKTRIGAKGTMLTTKNFSPYQRDSLEKAIMNFESCYIKATIDVNKVPGDFHISFHEYRSVYELFGRDKTLKESFDRMKLNHQLINLQFGDEKVKDYIVRKYSISDVVEAFGQKEPVVFDSDEDEKHKYNYDYYLKIIPFMFLDENKGEKLFAYQYSISYTSKLEEEETNEMPIIMFNYDFSPITMKVVIHKKSFLRFITHICAIVGGVFVIFSIINSIVVRVFLDAIEKE